MVLLWESGQAMYPQEQKDFLGRPKAATESPLGQTAVQRDGDFSSFSTETNLLYLNPILLSSLIYCLFKTATGAPACLKGALCN